MTNAEIAADVREKYTPKFTEEELADMERTESEGVCTLIAEIRRLRRIQQQLVVADQQRSKAIDAVSLENTILHGILKEHGLDRS